MFDAVATDETLADAMGDFQYRSSSTAKALRYEPPASHPEPLSVPRAGNESASKDWAGANAADVVGVVSTSFDIEDRASDADELFRSIVSSSRFPFRYRIATRLRDLYTMTAEEDDDDSGINLGALQALIGFLKSANLTVPPKIGVTDEGTVTAEWEVAQNRRLLLHFLAPNTANFAIVKPAFRAPGKTVTVYGNAPIGSISTVLDDNGATAWI